MNQWENTPFIIPIDGNPSFQESKQSLFNCHDFPDMIGKIDVESEDESTMECSTGFPSPGENHSSTPKLKVSDFLKFKKLDMYLNNMSRSRVSQSGVETTQLSFQMDTNKKFFSLENFQLNQKRLYISDLLKNNWKHKLVNFQENAKRKIISKINSRLNQKIKCFFVSNSMNNHEHKFHKKNKKNKNKVNEKNVQINSELILSDFEDFGVSVKFLDTLQKNEYVNYGNKKLESKNILHAINPCINDSNILNQVINGKFY